MAADGGAGDGSLERPFGVVQDAVIAASPGDVVLVRGGTYGAANAALSGTRARPAGECQDGDPREGGLCFEVVRSFVSISDWNGYRTDSPGFTTRNGRSEAPIRVMAAPGERVLFDAAACCARGIDVFEKSWWTISGIEMSGSMLHIGGGSATAQTHHIVIDNNDIHSVVTSGGDNPGLIRIDRGDVAGPTDITIRGNRLHRLSDPASAGQWNNTPDEQHFGAITVLSREEYLGAEGGGTGRIVIEGNSISEVPQALFFKNPMRGPIVVEGNTIERVGSLGALTPSNVSFINNTVRETDTGFWCVGSEPLARPGLAELSGQGLVIRGNLFEGLRSLATFRSGSAEISGNVFRDMSDGDAARTWGSAAYLVRSELNPEQPDAAASVFNAVRSDGNCFEGWTGDVEFAKRLFAPTALVSFESLDPAEAGTKWGWDRASEFVAPGRRVSAGGVCELLKR